MGIFFFLLVIILDTAVVRPPEAYTGVLSSYKNPVMGSETALYAIVYHAFNGIRIISLTSEATNRTWSSYQAKNKTQRRNRQQPHAHQDFKLCLFGNTFAGFAARHLGRSFSRMEVTKHGWPACPHPCTLVR